ncbi:MAG: hypothetical protein GX325_10605 [Peptococcaceae bacterium]|nr:hypothetical protein [Peptococcaceae bacterium]
MKKRKNVHYNLSLNNDKIVVTKHAIKRYKERREKGHISSKKIIKSIIGQIKQSKLIGIENETEYRMLNGYIYVVERQKRLSGDVLHVITMKLSNIKKRQHYLDRFDDDHAEIVS